VDTAAEFHLIARRATAAHPARTAAEAPR
jgi:hypothetical protein